MFLEITIRRNPELVREAFKLHRQGLIESNTYVIDLDAVRENARLIKDSAEKHGIKLYFITKQFGRNPILAKTISEVGIEKAVAVDIDEARVLYRNGIKIGHLGHLVQIPMSAIKEALVMKPEVITCFDVDKIKQINEVAKEIGVVQNILLRVVGDRDYFYPGQEGGIKFEGLENTAKKIKTLTHVKIVGVTSFPCFLYNENSQRIEPTENALTVKKAANLLREMGFEITQINGPSSTCVSSIPLLEKMGFTHGEPGHAFTGTTPLHAHSLEPEKPAIVYVSEVSHIFEDRAYVLGGGLYRRARVQKAYVPSKELLLDVDDIPPEFIDYYIPIKNNKNRVNVGDTVIFAFRTQIFVTRAKLAVIGGLQKGEPNLLGIFNPLGDQIVI